MTTPKVAIVTGVSKGIGSAIAVRLLEEGYEVHGSFKADLDGAKVLQEKFPDQVHIYQADFSQRTGAIKFCEHLAHLRVDAVVNNAGVVMFEDFNTFDFEI